jgi:ATP-dependent Lhr-like helicase
MTDDRLEPALRWFAERGWEAFPFQREAWLAWLEGKSGLLHAPTGQGKTLAAWFGPLLQAMESSGGERGLRVLWITPLRALSADTAAALREPLLSLGLPWTVEERTGDTGSTARKRQAARLPETLVTTPESLSVLLSQPDAASRFAGLQGVIVDEWHELMSTRRGTQTELCLARLRAWNPALRTWGLSATIGNLAEARDVLLGTAGSSGIIVAAGERRTVGIETIIPDEMEKFPWSGHLGVRMVPQVLAKIREATTTLLFTNTRSQAEIWYQALLDSAPDLAGELAMHHGSLDRRERADVEARLRAGSVRCVVCTSSLDLGVDFSPVEQVIQVGSPKGMARLLQRAGRSGHRPGAVSRIFGVPAHAFELVEFAAARDALARGEIEARRPLREPIDVLMQHLVTVACGGGFQPNAMLREVRTTHAFSGLSNESWEWLLGFITTGGHALRAYPQYQKVAILPDGTFAVTDVRTARLHRMTIGTIASDHAITVQYSSGRRLGSLEEWFISGIRPGGQFIFGGRRLELIRLMEMKAVVRDAKASAKPGRIPSWQGGKSPLSTELATAVSRKLDAAARGLADDPEIRAVAPILAIQSAWSRVPSPGELLIEETTSRDGSHVYVYPFAGRLVHEGIGTLAAWRMARDCPRSIEVSFNDYGFELHSRDDLSGADWPALLSPGDLLEDLEACLNTGELARRHFRDIARVAGLIIPGFPGQAKSARSLQVSSGLLYDVFARYDPANLLLAQAKRDILERQFEFQRLHETLSSLQQRTIVRLATRRLTPMAFPLWADLLSSRLSTESFTDRLSRMLADLEKAAAQPPSPLDRPEQL